MVNVDEDVFPRVSLAEHVTVFVPKGKVAPDGGTQETDRPPSTASLAVGAVNVTTAPEALVASVVMFVGVAEITGPVVSWTVRVNEPVAVFPAASVDEQFTVVVPIANVDPDGGAHVTAGFAGAVSVAVAV